MAFTARRAFWLSTRVLAVGTTAIAVHSYRKAILLDSQRGDFNLGGGGGGGGQSDFWTRLAGDLPRQFCAFADASPSPHHAVANAKALLVGAGFRELRERDAWTLEPGGRYFVGRDGESGTSLAAFTVGGGWRPGKGAFALVGTHVDSPCLRLKPVSRPRDAAAGYLQLGVELYGGGLWHTWFDRDLGMAGRVLVRTGDDDGGVESRLVNVRRPVLRVPSLAAHFRQHNPLKIDLENHLKPVLGSSKAEKERAVAPRKSSDGTRRSALDTTQAAVVHEISDVLGVSPDRILDMDVCLYDIQPATVGGTYDEYVFSARIDNLMMTYCGLVGFTRSVADAKALANDTSVRMLTLFDHEEIGSTSSLGAKSTFIPQVMKRICAETVKNGVNLGVSPGMSDTLFEQSMARSFFLSADMIHAVHPAHTKLHESNHQVKPNEGLVISSMPRNNFVRNTPGTYMLSEIARRSADLMPSGTVPKVQLFVPPNDLQCGATLGPMFATTTGLRTMDVGNSQLSMHSAREMAGAKDIANAVAILQGFYRDFVAVDEQTKMN